MQANHSLYIFHKPAEKKLIIPIDVHIWKREGSCFVSSYRATTYMYKIVGCCYYKKYAQGFRVFRWTFFISNFSNITISAKYFCWDAATLSWRNKKKIFKPKHEKKDFQTYAGSKNPDHLATAGYRIKSINVALRNKEHVKEWKSVSNFIDTLHMAAMKFAMLHTLFRTGLSRFFHAQLSWAWKLSC